MVPLSVVHRPEDTSEVPLYCPRALSLQKIEKELPAFVDPPTPPPPENSSKPSLFLPDSPHTSAIENTVNANQKFAFATLLTRQDSILIH